MFLTLIFWLVLMLPGYAAVRRWFAADVECGLLGVIGLSYLATFALLSPVAILGYIIGVPLWVFSGAIVIAVAWGAYDISRTGGWNDLLTLLRRGMCVELAIVAAIVGLDVLSGSIFHGDAMVHLTRIRFLIDNGLTNQDPYVAARAFYPIYHTNLLHALYASASQLSFTDHLGAWHMSAAWAKLMCACGGYLLGWFVFRKPWAAWMVAVFIVVHRGPVPFVVYPNMIAPFFVLPILIGLAVQAIIDGADRRTWIRLGACSLVIGQIHGLYVVFAVLAVGPILGVALIHRWIKRRDDRSWLLAAAAALLLGLPFPAVSKMTTKPITYDAAELRGYDEDRSQFVTADVALLGELRMRNPKQGFAGGWWRPLMLVAGCAIGVMTVRRRAVWVIAGIAGIAAVALYLPPVTTALLELLGREWILVRFEVLLTLCTAAVLPASVACLVDSQTHQWAVRILMVIAAVACGEIATDRMMRANAPYSWKIHIDNALGRVPDQSTALMPPPRTTLNDWRRHQSYALEHIEPGSVVFSDIQTGMFLSVLMDAHVIYSASSSLGVPDQQQRINDFATIADGRSDPAMRNELLRRYNVRYIYRVSAAPPAWADAIAVASRYEPELDVYLTEIDVQ